MGPAGSLEISLFVFRHHLGSGFESSSRHQLCCWLLSAVVIAHCNIARPPRQYTYELVPIVAMKFTANIFLTALLLGLHRSSAQNGCTRCDDKPTPAMEDKGKKCADFPNAIKSKCQGADNWVQNKFCRYTCSVYGRGYADEADCCAVGPSNAEEAEDETGYWNDSTNASQDGTATTSTDDYCSPNPCLNGGTCTDDASRYMCSCPVGYSGYNCGTSDQVTVTKYICDKKEQSDETICAEGAETCDSCDKGGKQCWVASCGVGGSTADTTGTTAGDGEIANADDGNTSVDSDSIGTEQASVGIDAATQLNSFSFYNRERRQKKRRNLRRE